jgi:phosphatidylserine decarboxylase
LADIVYWNRAQQREETEKVYGDALVRWLYDTPSGQLVANGALSRALPSKLYGAYQSSALSRRKIEPFIRDFAIPMDEYEPGPFGSFNDFFIRRFRPGVRVFETSPSLMPAFAEARYLGYENVLPEQTFPVKGSDLHAEALLGSSGRAKVFEGGPLLIARLCPVDYHRFHFPDSGHEIERYRMPGLLHSVNPLALKFRSDIFCVNERQISVLETENFGKLAYIEVGAMMVGKIVQTHEGQGFSRGDEKGYFLFGASTVIVMGEKGTWRPVDDLMQQTACGREVLVRLGEPVATQS